MKTSTAYNHQQRLSARMREIYATARHSGESHAWILDKIQARVHSDPAWDRVPGWVRAHVNQVGSACLDNLYRPILFPSQLDAREADLAAGRPVPPLPYLRWFHTYKGEHYVEWRDLPEAARDLPMREASSLGAFRWNHKRDRVF